MYMKKNVSGGARHVHVYKGSCPVYCSGHDRHYVGNDVVDESY